MLTSRAANGADPFITELRSREFARLDRNQLAYLDYTGSALYAESQLLGHREQLAHGVFGNPHAESDPSRASTAAIEEARTLVLRFLDADPAEYSVCFTANASAAIKLVAESFPFDEYSALLLTADNHNSINGVREYARRARAAVSHIALDEEMRLVDAEIALAHAAAASPGARLFAFPAQSNFTGVQHSLDLIDQAHSNGFDVLLDAASFAPSNALSLRRHSVDYVALSFYKIFGYPTGVGALVARTEKLRRLQRPWFAGGTVDFVSVQNDMHQLRALPDSFEDGTPDFLNIAALPAGFALLEKVGMPSVHDHVMRLTLRFLNGLDAMQHHDGSAVAHVYGPRDVNNRGGTVAFNLVSSGGQVVPYDRVERRAREAGVALRGGCFCNPGAAEHAFGFDAQRAVTCLRSTAQGGFTIDRFSDCLGAETAVGALRASFGLANNDRDIDRALEMVWSSREV